MLSLESLRTLMNYHYWANDRILSVVDTLTPEQFTQHLGGSFPSLQGTLVHLTNAEASWLRRMAGADLPSAAAEEVPTPAALRQRWASIEQTMRAFVGQLDDVGLQQVVPGKVSHLVWEVLQQLYNHGTYHRGQVTNMLRQLGVAAVQTDLLVYYRLQDQPTH